MYMALAMLHNFHILVKQVIIFSLSKNFVSPFSPYRGVEIRTRGPAL